MLSFYLLTGLPHKDEILPLNTAFSIDNSLR